MTYPSIYPTGTTIYDSTRCWNGYTLFQAKELGALLVNMNGAEVKLWKGLHGFPNKLLPGGYVIGHSGERNNAFGMQDYLDIIQVDWDGKIVWKFNEYEYVEDPGEDTQWMARAHHDFQREGNPVGYYSPQMDPLVDRGNTLILCHKDVTDTRISDKPLIDDAIIEVNWQGEILWEWICSEHFEEMGFREDAKNIICRNPNIRPIRGGVGDWMHMNSMSVLGPNKWYEAGDHRFHPDNLICCGRETNIIAIIEKKSGKIVWQLGPYYDETQKHRELGWIIGQHHAHMIPKGLPGEGNILVFDNGGWAGYGAPNPGAPTGANNALRDYSRVLEIDPTTLKIIWQYTPEEAGYLMPVDANRFYSPFISSVQRLPNGNSLITEGSGGRIIEVTSEHDLVWEYISPYRGTLVNMNMVYRAYRIPYDWVPQLDEPIEKSIEPLEVKNFRVPGAAPSGPLNVTVMQGVRPYQGGSAALCVLTDLDKK